MAGGTDFFRGMKFFLRLTLCWKKENLKWKVVPQKAQIWPCAGFPTPISTPESDSPRKITSIKGLGRVFFGFLHKMCLAGRIFSEGTKFFYDWSYVDSIYSSRKKFVRARNFGVVHGKSATLTPESKNKKNCLRQFFLFLESGVSFAETSNLSELCLFSKIK